MRTWIVPILGLLLGGCSLPVAGDSTTPLTWKGDFGRGQGASGHITLLFDEVGPTVSGTMFYESSDFEARATYRIEGTQEDGAIRFEQKEILDADVLTGGAIWCTGTYDLSLAQPVAVGETPEAPAAEASTQAPSTPGLSGTYSSRQDCGGLTTLQPVDTL